MFQQVWKPWYVWRPQQLLLQAVRRSRPRSGFRPLHVAWGGVLNADPTTDIGGSIWRTGVYDLTVTELLARLIRPGDTVVDIGANIGYMTAVAAHASGPTGEVLSFEPHPGLFAVLQQNVAMLANVNCASRVVLYNAALADAVGTADLVLPSDFEQNDGIAHLARREDVGCRSIPVRVETLDSVLGRATVRVMKIDVEGFELAVLRGAAKLLSERRVLHILFEEHRGPESDVVEFLRSFGYEIFATGWSVRGPKIAPVGHQRLAAAYEPQNYLATRAPDQVIALAAERGWRMLNPRWVRAGCG